ncbi:BON domain-containing protein [Bacteriovorax sp. PP10]|uniref:BON domain-containing protein n=1 Tax=Bacteriovorax antarcticus TaxID=3088717 RepID=A0ABU5VRG3_9BACT|nr:BON domain-containing protein [Bacteriovorax sp. PP10]MEA9355648.1 BON domain-containing protein [Bacteriovorax sp. PP10]
MNRKHRNQSMQSQQPRGTRAGQQFNQNYGSNQSYGSSHSDQDQDYEGMQTGPRSRNFSGNSSWSADDSALDNTRSSSQSYRDTDYDLDGSTYGGQGRSPRGMDRNFGGRLGASEYGSSYGSTYGEYETNDRNRQPSRYSPLDEDRYSGSDRGSRFASDRNMDRSGSSSERFGYPSNMNAWSGADRSYNSGRTPGRMGQGTFGTQDMDSTNLHSYGAAGTSAFGTFGDGVADRSDWGSTHSNLRNFHGKGPKGYKRSDDRIKEDVCETLARDPRIDASEIEVKVDNAMVTLSGTVDSREVKRAAEMIIENLSGVDDVKNDLKVKRSEEAGYDMQASSGTSRLNSGASSSQTSKSTSTKGTSHI